MVMKKIFFAAFAALAVLVSSCGDEAAEPDAIRTGDLLFVDLPSDYDLSPDSLTVADTASAAGEAELMRIHVAILEVHGDSTWIIDATIKHGVDRHPLDTFLTDFTLRDGSLPVFEVMRPDVSAEEAESFVENAKKYLGQPYDVHFLPDNGALYCSELVYNSYVTADGKHLFSEGPMNWKGSDGEVPLYWRQLFGLLGQEVPQDIVGTNPQEMAEEPCLSVVDCPLVR